MKTVNHNQMIERGKRGGSGDVHFLMDFVRQDSELTALKQADHALSFVDGDDGRKAMLHFLFNGTKIQRNYCVNYFRRREDRRPILEAWERGIIDDIQAFSR